MGFLDNVTKSLKDIGKKVIDEAKRIQELNQTKIRILNNFELKDLKSLCKAYGREPLPYEVDIITGKRRRIRLNRNNYFDNAMKLSLEQIKRFCERRRIRISKIIHDHEEFVRNYNINKIAKRNTIRIEKKPVGKKVTEIEIKRQSEFDSILESIEEDFQRILEDLNIRHEREFRRQLLIFLRTRNYDAKEEVKTSKGIVDILIDKKYALELKYADNTSTLHRGIGEVKRYRKEFDNVAVIILDINKINYSDIQEYIEDYESDGAQVIVLRGRGHRKKKNRSTKIRINGRNISIN